MNMSLFTILCLSLWVNFVALGQNVEKRMNFEDAFKKANIENKDVFVVLTIDGCCACDLYIKAVGKDNELCELLSDRYVYVNCNVKGNRFLSQMLSYYGFPLTCIFSPTGDLLLMLPGNKDNKTIETIKSNSFFCDSLFIVNSSLGCGTDKYVVAISSCMKAYLQYNNIIEGDAKVSICESIEGIPYYYNLYLGVKIFEQGNLIKASQLAKNITARTRITDFEKFMYQDLIYEINSSYGNKKNDIVCDDALEFESKLIDCGKVNYKENINVSLKALNTTKEAIIVNSIRSSCDCMDYKWNKEPVLPDKIFEIEMNYKAKNKGVFSKTVFIRTNKKKEYKITVKGEVV